MTRENYKAQYSNRSSSQNETQKKPEPDSDEDQAQEQSYLWKICCGPCIEIFDFVSKNRKPFQAMNSAAL